MHLHLLPYLKEGIVTTSSLTRNLLASTPASTGERGRGRIRRGQPQKEEGWRSRSLSKPHPGLKSRGCTIAALFSPCSSSASSESDPPVTEEEKLPNLFGISSSIPRAPPSCSFSADLSSLFYHRGDKPMEKKLLLSSGVNISCSRCTYCTAASLLGLSCLSFTV